MVVAVVGEQSILSEVCLQSEMVQPKSGTPQFTHYDSVGAKAYFVRALVQKGALVLKVCDFRVVLPKCTSCTTLVLESCDFPAKVCFAYCTCTTFKSGAAKVSSRVASCQPALCLLHLHSQVHCACSQKLRLSPWKWWLAIKAMPKSEAPHY